MPGISVLPDVRIPEWEERRLPRQCNSHKKGKFITDSSQGSCYIQRSAAGSKSPEPQLGEHKQLVAGLSRLVTCLQSNLSGTNFHRLLFKLRRSRAFPLSLMFPLFPFGHLLIGWLQVAWWGWGILPIQGKLKFRSGLPVSPGSSHSPHLCFYGRPNHGSSISSVGTVEYWDLSNIRWTDRQCVFSNNSPLRDFILKMLFGNWGGGLFLL